MTQFHKIKKKKKNSHRTIRKVFPLESIHTPCALGWGQGTLILRTMTFHVRLERMLRNRCL